VSDLGQFATSSGVPHQSSSGARFLVFSVAPEIVEQNLDWSEPHRVKFEKNDDGTVTLWLQSVEA
jgi:hypothetical protein